MTYLTLFQNVLSEASKRNESMANKQHVSDSWFDLLNSEVMSALRLPYLTVCLFDNTESMLSFPLN